MLPFPPTYYVLKVNIETGKVQRINLPGAIGSQFFWINENKIIYNLQNDSRMYKSDLKW